MRRPIWGPALGALILGIAAQIVLGWWWMPFVLTASVNIGVDRWGRERYGDLWDES